MYFNICAGYQKIFYHEFYSINKLDKNLLLKIIYLKIKINNINKKIKSKNIKIIHRT